MARERKAIHPSGSPCPDLGLCERLGDKGQDCHSGSAKSRDKTVPALLGQLLSDRPRKPCLSEGKTKHNTTHTHPSETSEKTHM